jgi:hypothetical protein
MVRGIRPMIHTPLKTVNHMGLKFMELPPHKPGYWWENVAPLGAGPVWQERVAPIHDEGRIFGYDKDEFMAKQYRRKAA